MNGLRIEQMKFTFSFPLINTTNRQAVNRDIFFAESKEMFCQCFFGYFIKTHSFNP